VRRSHPWSALCLAAGGHRLRGTLRLRCARRPRPVRRVPDGDPPSPPFRARARVGLL
ncbi:MAG: hypothetical protein AVDCRST_MAG38-755, partial [uncultured Solirubrobacteraceae bacterium]